ncbi:hypothetical protein [Streptomyces sp. NPDC001307]|uniref:hypothetical protein n=1 Tax=Streptomyces sp. NPDC001307 TaxID=3364560 RepID=UPI0036CAC35F
MNERTVVARVAMALQAAIKSWGGRWRVDVEYDRWHHPNFGVIKKALYVDGFDAAHRRPVYPDLILHDPHGCFQERNLLVLEAKRGRPRRRDRDFDLAKLRAYLRELHYRQAAYLEFDGCGGPPRLQCSSCETAKFAPLASRTVGSRARIQNLRRRSRGCDGRDARMAGSLVPQGPVTAGAQSRQHSSSSCTISTPQPPPAARRLA